MGINANLAALSPLEAFLVGALAKAMATLVTYPLQLAQVLLRLQTKKLQPTNATTKQHDTPVPNDDSDATYEGTLDCLYKRFSMGGVQALFTGMNAKLLQTVLTAASTFLTYEQTLMLVARIYAALDAKR